MISQRTIDAIRERAQILDLIGEHRQIKRSGADFVCLCPFHAEKTPSCHIRPAENKFYCFGCNVGGNVFSFVMRHEGVTFPEAIEILARRYGIPVERELGERAERREDVSRQALFEIHRVADEFFRKSIERAPTEVKAYLRQRGLGEEALSRFGIGYAPKDRAALVAVLRQHKFDEAIMVASGLVRRGSSGHLYDTFRGRLQFPIFIDSSRVVAFGGRVIPGFSDQSEGDYTPPKYLNSPETPIYRKQSVLFGLPQALETIRTTKEVYLVEGYMDVVSLAMAGVRGVVATCGTATTLAHLQRLVPLVRRIVTIFDGDRAGRDAAARAFRVLCNAPLELSSIFLDEGDDPDTFARRHGENTLPALQALSHIPLADAFIEVLVRSYGAASAAELGAAAKGAVAREVVQVIEGVTDPIARAEFLKWAAFTLGVDERLLCGVGTSASGGPSASGFRSQTQRVGSGGSGALRRESEGGGARGGSLSDVVPRAEGESAPGVGGAWPAIPHLPQLDRELLRCAMGLAGELPVAIEEDSSITHFLEPATLFFISELKRILGSDHPYNEKKRLVGWLLRECGPSWVELWKQALAMRDAREVDFQGVFIACYQLLKKQILREQVQHLEGELQATTSPERRIELAQRKLQLEREARRDDSGARR